MNVTDPLNSSLKTNLRQASLRVQHGQTIIQVLVAVAIMTVIMAVFAGMMTSQWRETRALTEKLAAMDLEKLLISSMADGAVCAYVLNNPTTLTFNSATLPQIITLPNPNAKGAPATLYTNILPGLVPGAIAVQDGGLASPISQNLKVKSIQLQINAGSNGHYVGQWIVIFDPASMVRSLAPVTVSTVLEANDTTNPLAATITSCAGGSGTGNINANAFSSSSSTYEQLTTDNVWTDLGLSATVTNTSGGPAKYLLMLNGPFCKGGKVIQFQFVQDGTSIALSSAMDTDDGASPYQQTLTGTSTVYWTIAGTPVTFTYIQTIADSNPHVITAQWRSVGGGGGPPSQPCSPTDTYPRVLTVIPTN